MLNCVIWAVLCVSLLANVVQLLSNRPKTVLKGTCECGHGRSMHYSGHGTCMKTFCDCAIYIKAEHDPAVAALERMYRS